MQSAYNLLDQELSQSIKLKLKSILSCIEEKSMRILILLIQLSNNFTYSRVLQQQLASGAVQKLLDRLDFLALDLNDRMDMLFYDLYELFDEKINPQDFRFIRHSISGDTYDLFRKLALRNGKGKASKWNSVYDWVFNGSSSKCIISYSQVWSSFTTRRGKSTSSRSQASVIPPTAHY